VCLDFWRSRRSWSFQRCLNPVVVHVANRRIAGDRRAAGMCRKARVDASTLEFCRLERRSHRRSFVEPPAVISTVDISCLCGFDGEFRPLAIADQRSCNGIDRETASAPNALCTPIPLIHALAFLDGFTCTFEEANLAPNPGSIGSGSWETGSSSSDCPVRLPFPWFLSKGTLLSAPASPLGRPFPVGFGSDTKGRIACKTGTGNPLHVEGEWRSPSQVSDRVQAEEGIYVLM